MSKEETGVCKFKEMFIQMEKKNVYFSKATFYWLKCSDLEGKESRKNMLHISSSYLNKNNIDDQKVFSLSGLVLTEYSFFFLSTNKPCFYLTDCLNVSDMDLNPFLMLIWGC